MLLDSAHISISGNYLVSCFGSSLETLVHLHTYIREVPVADLLDLTLTSSWDTCTIPASQPRSSSPSPSPTPSPRAPSPLSTPPYDIPKELFQLVSFLDTHALKQVRGQRSEVNPHSLSLLAIYNVIHVMYMPNMGSQTCVSIHRDRKGCFRRAVARWRWSR